jgi:hypothetical protein
MLTNWRSNLMLSRLSFKSDDNFMNIVVSKDIYKPVKYIVLDKSKLNKKSVLEWAKENFQEYGFDFDCYSSLLWSNDDNVPEEVIVSRINSAIPNFASIKLISPALAHGLDDLNLNFNDSSDYASYNDDNIDLHF